jgi:hypothetical protein
LDSIWSIFKGIGKPLEKAQITQIPAGEMFLLAGCDEKSGK